MIRRAVLALAITFVPTWAWAAARPDAGTAPSGRKAKPAKTSGSQAADKAAKPKKKAARYAPVELFHINTKEKLMLRFYDDRGKPIKGWKKRFDKFMRCHLTGVVFKMDSRLPQMLYQVGRHFDGHRLEVVSGYRHPKVAKNPKSPHKEGLACDFRVAGIGNPVLRDYLRKAFDHAGVGYYPNSVFVHLDNRKQGPAAFWIDCAGPGQEASYAENPREGLRNGQADAVCAPRKPAGDGQEGGAASGGNNFGPKPVEVKAASDPFE